MKKEIIAIIGLGKEGQHWKRFFEEWGHTVLTSDRDQDNQGVINQASVIVLAVPMHVVVAVIESLRFRKDQLIISAVGEWTNTTKALAKVSAGSILLHRMCGPVASMEGQNLIADRVRRFRGWLPGIPIDDLLKKINAKVVWSNPDEHDRNVSVTQSLLRLVCICFFVALLRLKVKLSDLKAFSSPPFRFFKLVMLRILGQGAELCFDMLSSHTHAKESISAMHDGLTEIEDLISRKDREGFRQLFLSFNQHVGDEALKKANVRFQKLVEDKVDQWD